jgi:hypothetical protein
MTSAPDRGLPQAGASIGGDEAYERATVVPASIAQATVALLAGGLHPIRAAWTLAMTPRYRPVWQGDFVRSMLDASKWRVEANGQSACCLWVGLQR